MPCHPSLDYTPLHVTTLAITSTIGEAPSYFAIQAWTGLTEQMCGNGAIREF